MYSRQLPSIMMIRDKPRRGHQYWSVVTSRRIADNPKPREQTILYLGRLDNIDEPRRLDLERKIRELAEPTILNEFRAKLYSLGYKFPSPISALTVEEVYDYGLPLALHKVCEDIQFVDVVNKHGYKGGGHSLGAIVEAMAIHRVSDPGSHRDLIRWYPTTTLPGYLRLKPDEFSYVSTLRALDYLQPKHTIPMQIELYDNIRSAYGHKCDRLDIDLTSSYFEGWECLLAKLGYSRDHRSDRPQIVIGFVVDQEGILVTHKVWPGNRTDATSLKPLNRLLKDEFKLDCPRVVDRGIATAENLEYMDRRKERYLVALRAKIKSTKLLDEITVPRSKWEEISEGEFAISIAKGRRKYVVNWNSEVAETNRKGRMAKVRKAEKKLKELKKKISEGRISSRKERDEEIGHILKKNKVRRFINIQGDRKGFGFRFERNTKLDDPNQYEGYQVFVTTEKHLTEKEIVSSYRARDEVEKAIETVKGALGLRPMYVWTKEHVIGQIFVCAQAYQLRSVMAMRLKQANLGMSINDALWKLDRLKAVNIVVTGDEMQVIRKVTTMNKNQMALVDIFKMQEGNGGL